LVKDVSDSNRLKTTVGGLIKAWANISANYTTITGTVTRTGNTATITKTGGHNLRVGDVIYTTGGIATSWYEILTVPSSTTFTVVTAISGDITTPVSINWYQHTVLAGNNVNSAYGRDTARVIRVNFTNKPPSVDSYILNLSAVKFTSATNLFTPQVNNIDSNVPSNIVKTVNGFTFVSYSTSGLVTSTSGEFHFQSIW
jgi:hypothetical protein